MVITGSDILDAPPSREGNTVEAPVHGGLCRLKFIGGISTGPTGSDSYPGVGFEILFDTAQIRAYPVGDSGLYAYGMGVIGRSGARHLRDMLTEFLHENGN